MIKITVNGVEHILETLEDNTPNFEGYSTSINTQNALKAAYDAGADNWRPYTLPEPVPELPAPNWDGFNSAIMIDPRLNQVLGLAYQTAPAVASGLGPALTLVSTNGVAAFRIAFNGVCQIAGATNGDRESWATIAESFDLPTDFVNVIRGQ